jgi:polyvinyl alcohol dehydrogenase (cytochrome)
MKRLLKIAAVGGLWISAGYGQSAQQAPAPPLGTEQGFALFQTRCMTCHGNPSMAGRAPDPNVIRQYSPERIYEALTTGPMKAQGASLSDDQKKVIALFMSGRPLGSAKEGDMHGMINQCKGNSPMKDPASMPAWNGWGADLFNTRYQPAHGAGLSADKVRNLKLKWAFGFPTGLSAFGQPTVVSGRVFVGSDIGYVYSLDAKTGCVHWSFQAKGSVRNAIVIGAVKQQGFAKFAAFFGDAHANVYAVDAQTGAQLWTGRMDEHFTARITAAPAYHEGKLYVPVSSSEEFSGSTLDYPCCTFRGSVVALNASSGERIWKTFVIPEEPKPTRRNSKGVQLYAPAGASVWNTPTVDVKKKAIYFGTGDSETEPAAKTSDSVMALDIEDGHVKWVYQVQENDAFLGGCGPRTNTENCPEKNGPDLDIGNSPILRTLGNGKRILLTATKDGRVIAVDPDNKGALVWKTDVSKNSSGGKPTGDGPGFGLNGVVWGGAADERVAYYGLSGGGMVALQLATGEKLWFAPIIQPGQRVSHAAATTAIPGVAFVGGSDGKIHALATKDGKEIWSYDTNKEFEAVNGVETHGGAMGAPGPTVAGGMLFVGSGYGVVADLPGNALLAFSPQ